MRYTVSIVCMRVRVKRLSPFPERQKPGYRRPAPRGPQTRPPLFLQTRNRGAFTGTA